MLDRRTTGRYEMSYVTVGNGKLSNVTLPSNAHEHSGSMSVKTTNQRPLSTGGHHKFPLAMVALLAAAFGFNPGVRAQDVAPPISGALGQVQSVGDHSITIQTKSGLVHIDITQPLTTYLVGHSYGGAVITEAGNDPKVVGLVYVAALAPSDGESVASVTKPFPPAPLGSEVKADAESFLTVTPKGIAEDFAQYLPDEEKQLLTATQGPTAAAVFGATITTAAWKTKPSWCVIASNDRAVSPELEKAEAAVMKPTSITIPSSHVPMLSHPKEVTDLIEQAAAKGGNQ